MGTDLQLAIMAVTLLKHGTVTGITGYSKSNFLKILFLQFVAMGIPVTVLECAKTEWRELLRTSQVVDANLKKALNQVRIYQAGENAVSPLRIAPFLPAPGIALSLFKENLYRCLEGALPMEAPLPQILDAALERLFYSVIDPAELSFARLLEEALLVLDERGYSGELSTNLRGALETRLAILASGTAGHVFSAGQNIPAPEELLSTSKIIELDGLTEEKLSLVMLFLMTRFWETARTQPWEGGLPRHIFLIEEASALFATESQAHPDAGVADPQSYVTDMIVRMLQEFRAAGVGVILCSQSPSALPKRVLKNVRTKVAFLVGDGEDRDTLANAMLLDPKTAEELGRLKCGEAYVWTEGLYRAKKIKTPLWTDMHKEFKQ